jgi:hypothetical protein
VQPKSGAVEIETHVRIKPQTPDRTNGHAAADAFSISTAQARDPRPTRAESQREQYCF